MLLTLTKLDVDRVLSNFKSPTLRIYWGKLRYGTPYFFPMGFNRYIISIKKLNLRKSEEYEQRLAKMPYQANIAKYTNWPMVRRSKYWVVNIFKTPYYITIGRPIAFYKVRLGWKDKFSSPRFEWAPTLGVIFFNWQLHIYLESPGDFDNYWEQILWTEFYSDGCIKKAKKTWPWRDHETNKSSWDNKYLKDGLDPRL